MCLFSLFVQSEEYSHLPHLWIAIDLFCLSDFRFFAEKEEENMNNANKTSLAIIIKLFTDFRPRNLLSIFIGWEINLYSQATGSPTYYRLADFAP